MRESRSKLPLVQICGNRFTAPLALYGLGETSQARQAAIYLLTLTEPEGYIRVYLDGGEPMRRVLQSLLDTPHNHEATLSAARISYILTLDSPSLA